LSRKSAALEQVDKQPLSKVEVERAHSHLGPLTMPHRRGGILLGEDGARRPASWLCVWRPSSGGSCRCCGSMTIAAMLPVS
jgi:hypothetical protein